MVNIMVFDSVALVLPVVDRYVDWTSSPGTQLGLNNVTSRGSCWDMGTIAYIAQLGRKKGYDYRTRTILKSGRVLTGTRAGRG
jgi:hypothetical protein